jgi:23S rRNA pseudouridine2605 synthase
VASRRACEALIRAGRVTVDGQPVTELGTKVDPDRAAIAVDRRPIEPVATVTYLLNKPAGYITTRSDPQGRPTVMSLLPAVPGLHPVGRLDVDSEGLLLLTNDGELTHLLTHPRHMVQKIYHAQVAHTPTVRTLRTLANGVKLEEGVTAPAQVRVVRTTDAGSLLEIAIHEGRKRQVKRMLKAVGHPVLRLVRVAEAGLRLGRLNRGGWRRLSRAEVAGLKRRARGGGG